MPKRSRRRSRKRTRKRSRKSSKAKTRVDKRQDRVIRKLVLESMPERKWFDSYYAERIPNAEDQTTLFNAGLPLTNEIPIWESEKATSNLQFLNSRQGLEIHCRNIQINGAIIPPRMDQVAYTLLPGGGAIQSPWPEHFVIRLMVVHLPKPCEHGGTGPTITDILETPIFHESTWGSPPESGWDVLNAQSPVPQYSRYRKPYAGDKFNIVVNKVITLEGAKQNIANTPIISPGISNDVASSDPAVASYAYQPTGLHSSRPHSINMTIPVNKKIRYEQGDSNEDYPKQVTNLYKLFVFACNKFSDIELSYSPLCTMEFQSRVNFMDP